jgi:hypothetical protein
MGRVIDVMRVVAVAAFVLGLGFLIAPTRVGVAPLALPALGADTMMTAAPVPADSLTEDIILYNLFSPSRSAPSRRYAAQSAGGAMEPDESNPSGSSSGGFSPSLIGTAVSDRPGETRALLQLIASDPTPRLYAVGDRAGGYSVVSIDARAVVLNGPRGRVVLRLPDNEESHS